MCGLVGVAGKLAYKDEKLFKTMVFFDFLRGADATGVAAVRDGGEIHIAKLATDPITFFQYPKVDQVINGNQSKAFIGHNRHATMGAKTNYNAHPFEYEGIVGAHNGTLDIKSWERLEEAVGEKFPVDSFALIAGIAKLGVKDAIELCTEGRETDKGAWALSWYDSNDGSVNLLRNKHRPLWTAYDSTFDRVFWASEWWMIEAAVRNSGLYELYKDPETGYMFWPTEEDQHLKFDLGVMAHSDKKPKPKSVTVKGREPVAVAPTVFPTRQHGMGFSVHGTVCGGSGTASSKKKNKTSHGTTTQHGSSPEKVVHWLGDTKSPLAGYLDRDNFEKLAKYGCSWCQQSVDFEEPGIVIFERDDVLLCPRCAGHDEIDDDTASRIYAPPENFSAIMA